MPVLTTKREFLIFRIWNFLHDPAWVLFLSCLSFLHATTADSSEEFRFFAGVATGYGVVSSPTYLEAPHGSEYLLNTAISLQPKDYLRRWLFDGGIGWIYSSIGGKTLANQPVQIAMRSGLLELSPRFRISDHIQIGPVFNLAFGTDTSFMSTVSQPTSSYFLGIKVVDELSYNQVPIRIWSQVSTDVGMQNQQVYFALLGLQVGLPIKILRPLEPPLQRPPTEVRTVRVILDPKKIFFNTASATLKKRVQVALKDVGQYLREHEGPTTVEVSGHADQRGRYRYNLELSKRRAEAVRGALISGGAVSSKLTLRAYSYLHPLDPANNQSAWAKNRRVELVFDQVENSRQLIEKLKPLELEQSIQIEQSHYDSNENRKPWENRHGPS